MAETAAEKIKTLQPETFLFKVGWTDKRKLLFFINSRIMSKNAGVKSW